MMRTIRRIAALGVFAAILAATSMPSIAQNSHTLPLVLPASNAALTGFVRIINNTSQSGTVSITAIDDTGSRFGPVTLNLESEETINFNSRDLENGNARKGLSGGVGNGEGNWRLILDSDLGITPLAYIRTTDGFVTSMHNVAPETEAGSKRYRIVFFNPGANRNQVSRLRLINPGTTAARVEITGRDDAGMAAPGGTVRLTLPAGGARTLTAQTLESGGEGITGNLGEGTGKWQLTISSNVSIDAVSLLQSPTGHLANLSSTPESSDRFTLPLVLPASESALTGFVRIINRSQEAGSVRVTAIDDTGRRFGPINLNLESNETVNFNSRDLEQGNATKGLSGGVGNGQGNWRLEFDTTLDVATLAYIRTSDGFVTSMHNVTPSTNRNHRVRFFNPGSNNRQVSQLRLTNPGTSTARITITGRDDAGDPAPGGEVGLTLAAGDSRTLTAQALENGGEGITGSLGDGTGKWQLTVSADRDIDVMSLLQSPTGHLANLSTSPSEDAPASFAGAVPLSLENETISGEFGPSEDEKYYTVTFDETGIMEFNTTDDIEITVFDEQGNVIARSTTTTTGAAQGESEIGRAVPAVIVAAVFVYKAGKLYVRIRKNSSATRAAFKLTKIYAALAIQKARNFARGRSFKYGEIDNSLDVDLSEFFEGESELVTMLSIQPEAVDVPFVGTLTALEFDTNYRLRMGLHKNQQCGRGSEYLINGTIKLALAWNQRWGGRTIRIPIVDFGDVPFTISRETSPRRVGGSQGSIPVRVAPGRSETTNLSSYIEDPDGGSLTFAVSNEENIPSGWGVTENGTTLTFSASENAVDGQIIVTATDPAGECWNFPVRLSVSDLWGAFSLFLPSRVRGCLDNPIIVYVTDRPSQSVAIADAVAKCEGIRNTYSNTFQDCSIPPRYAFTKCGAVAFGSTTDTSTTLFCASRPGTGATPAAAEADAITTCNSSRTDAGIDHLGCRVLASVCNSGAAANIRP